MDKNGAHQRAWGRRLQKHINAGGQVSVLSASGAPDWQFTLPRQLKLAYWEYGRRLVLKQCEHIRQVSVTPANLSRVPAGVDLLLAAISLPSLVKPARTMPTSLLTVVVPA